MPGSSSLGDSLQGTKGVLFLIRTFIDQGKPVFHVEYPKGAAMNNNDSVATSQTSICGDERAKGFSTIINNMDLEQRIETC